MSTREEIIAAKKEEGNALALLDLQAEVREVNEANGWWDIDRPFSADIALLHSEISELHEAMLHNDEENVAEEFADIFIRLLDTAERKMLELAGEVSIPHGAEKMFYPGVAALHGFTTRAYEVYRKYGDDAMTRGTVAHAKITNEFKCLLSLVMASAAILEIDLIAEYRKKIARNRERGYRHGGKAE